MGGDCSHSDNVGHGCELPKVRDHEHLLSHDCKNTRGGDMTVKPPEYTLQVTNPPDGSTFLPGS